MLNKQSKKVNSTTGIYSMIYQRHPNNIFNALIGYKMAGGEDGGIQEKIASLQEGQLKRGGRYHALHKNRLVDHRLDSKAPATTE